MFCEMLTGSPVFEADNQYKLMYMIVNKQVAAPSKSNPEISPKLDEMILKALEKAPASRFANAEEMKEALDSFLKPEKEEENCRENPRTFPHPIWPMSY
ncbi:MAG: hypothetical protein B6240_14190 [Desulfobacteraceae bacterium 4572_87]|nr:MAG: hypothetical protein B6240_14190 [Desulfobacteraceae bacterium 4572_87]